MCPFKGHIQNIWGLANIWGPVPPGPNAEPPLVLYRGNGTR